MNLTRQFLEQRKDNALDNLRKADRFWLALRSGTINYAEVVKETQESLPDIDCDVVICGGTLGILLGAALQKLGVQVTVIERGLLKGREQEWNISRQELDIFCELELLTEAELEQAIATEYNPGRVGFLGGRDIWVEDVLNIGVNPIYLLEKLKKKFVNTGGKLLENTGFQSATISADGVEVKTDLGKLTTRLLIDAMGHFSPIVKQIRKGVKPDSICTVVGSCADGYERNETGDLIYSFTPIINQCQYFWEAFPAREGRTTYMFSYLDAHPERPSLDYFMSEYLRLLSDYQNVNLEQLDFKRFLFGFFPAYRQSPLKIPFDRILAIGDSNGGQSPVSFGGFGAMVRHLKRLTKGVYEALQTNSLTQKDLTLIQPYQPNISVTWLFQKTMSVEVKQKINPNQINNLMNGVFSVMERLGDDIMKPFLQDVIQFIPLAKTLPLVNPKLVLPILPQVGINPLLSWSWEYFNLALYSGLYPLGKVAQPLIKNLSPKQQYYYHRYLDAWKYGSGGDYIN
ncbi:Flavin-dependent dehydrogenase [Hyella patelloides LEGE 07179]|uniref:Flavin-dependent dehydrogenase n=1 Tax=Hyella patelloides LEGE 07179 TaxID=945734 RepID=A0A563VTQ4_9CYAN|nr:FAD-binding oxidoreductase [Hyella patelloides]VEP14856.1 Flavin-dependent dehydrogenase [Hyella patelloides LEGE 07179]